MMSGEVELEDRDSDPLLEDHQQRQSDEETLALLTPPTPPLISSSTEMEMEIQTEDLESGSLPCCRICLEHDAQNDDELISPCMCKGTQQFVHRSCLDHWRSVKEGFAFSHCTTCKAQFHLRIAEIEDNSWRKVKFRLFVARDVFLVFLAVQTVIALIAVIAYLMDKDGSFRNSFNDSWDRILSKHPIPFYYCIGVICFFVLLGFFGLILHCSSLNGNDPRVAGCQNCCYGWGILDCFPASMEACFALVIVFVVIFAILGIAYGFLAATMALQRIWQRHYHILTKRELTQCLCGHCGQGSYGEGIHDPSMTVAGARVKNQCTCEIHQRLLNIDEKQEAKTPAFHRSSTGSPAFHRIFNCVFDEYIVEDLRGCYTPPKLDSEHEERLKMLKLL